jgi:hypothetical protein
VCEGAIRIIPLLWRLSEGENTTIMRIWRRGNGMAIGVWKVEEIYSILLGYTNGMVGGLGGMWGRIMSRGVGVQFSLRITCICNIL